MFFWCKKEICEQPREKLPVQGQTNHKLVIKCQARVVRKADNAIQRIAWFVLSTLIHWIAIYPVDSVIRGQVQDWNQGHSVGR